ncbi:class IV adenylate cyclase [Lignipirellula cremea]|uniref:CYTH domain protein n=1 Tax=Lignipirellula cremea TaxID=2528010 RepID=A0A518DUD8_9BACT|nr:class IV adenylate cyclase [Lignipirellula cremea]QDU95453.1 CYTH domain protein [Lignipirellula cremea]
MSSPVCQNIEIKARLADLESARDICARLETPCAEVELQVDTYFDATAGRLKLREIQRQKSGTQAAELIGYQRPDQGAAKTSSYHRVELAPGDPMQALLSLVLPVRQVVVKRREIYLWKNVRVHLDEVEGLGLFLEFEAVVGPDCDVGLCRERVDYLIEQFGLAPEDLIAHSYVDM